MPTLFDSHDEFNEWFSKDIESHAERQSGIDESMWSALSAPFLVCSINFTDFVVVLVQTMNENVILRQNNISKSCSFDPHGFGSNVSDQLSRLHMILKPFMLRRVKKDVENELSDKVSDLYDTLVES